MALESVCQCGICKKLSLIPGRGGAPGGGKGNPLQYSCLENPWTEEPGELQFMGVPKSRTWLSTHTASLWNPSPTPHRIPSMSVARVGLPVLRSSLPAAGYFTRGSARVSAVLSLSHLSFPPCVHKSAPWSCFPSLRPSLTVPGSPGSSGHRRWGTVTHRSSCAHSLIQPSWSGSSEEGPATGAVNRGWQDSHLAAAAATHMGTNRANGARRDFSGRGCWEDGSGRALSDLSMGMRNATLISSLQLGVFWVGYMLIQKIASQDMARDQKTKKKEKKGIGLFRRAFPV